MYIAREQFDRDRHEGRENYSKLPTELNRYNMYCSNCHSSFYVDKAFYEQIVTSMEEGQDNPFICDDCRDELAELESWQGH